MIFIYLGDVKAFTAIIMFFFKVLHNYRLKPYKGLKPL